MKKQIDINNYLPQLQEDYQKELFKKVCEVLESKGITIQTESEMKHIFKDRIKGEVTENETTLYLDGIPLCAYGQLEAKIEGEEIATKFKFIAL